MSNFCPNCGKPVKSTDNVCGNCGTPLKNTQSNVHREVASRSQQPKKKNHSAYKWIIGAAVVVILAGAGYLFYQNTANTNNSAATTSSKKSDSAQSKSSTSNSSNNSSDDQGSSSEENDDQEDTTSSDNQESTTSSSQQEDNDEDETLAGIGPKTVASSVLVLGGKNNEAWKSLSTQDNPEINVIQPTSDSDNDNYSEPGTGVAYMFTFDGRSGGEILEYRISRDESTIYCYEQSSKDAYDRHVTPFATLSAKEIRQVKDSARVQDLVNKMEVKAD